MKLKDIFNQLSSNEFSQLSIGGQPRGVINEHNLKQVVDHINLALTQLHSRFMLKESHLTISLKPRIWLYQLNSDFAVANRRSRQEVRYILDDAHAPFMDDVMRIERVHSDTGFEFDLNDHTKYWGLLTPTMTSIQVPQKIVQPDSSTPDVYKTQYLDVVYRADHPKITVGLGYFDPARVDVLLPETHLNALLLFIASRVNNPVGMVNEFNAGNNYAAKFEAECQRLKLSGFEVDQVGAEDRARQKGFV